MNPYKKTLPALAAPLLTALAITLGGCSEDSSLSEETGNATGTLTEVTLNISSLRSGSATGDGTPSDPVKDEEKINSWWIAFVDSNGKVRQIVNRQATGPVEMETFKCTVPPGLYTIYAFANITPSELKTAAGVEFTVGSQISLPTGMTDIVDAIWTTSLNAMASTKLIPMAGFLSNIRVKNITEEVFSIEVVRMVAKMEFLFSNPGNKAITVNNISVDPVTVTSISLFPMGPSGPGYSHLGQSAYKPLSGADYDKVVFTLGSGNVVTAAEENKSVTVYLQESISSRENDEAFTIGLNVSHDGGVQEQQQYNITRDILSYINRNDHIVIPVTLSRYAVDVEAIFYPPIGGYPAVAEGLDPDGSQIFTFSSGGDFSVVARVTDKQTGRHLAPHFYSVTVSEISDPQSIFTASPAVAAVNPALPDEIEGALSFENKGKATFKVTVSVYDKERYDAAARVTDRYTRTIYIIRD